jgi:hypothetical protein
MKKWRPGMIDSIGPTLNSIAEFAIYTKKFS